MAQFWLVWPKFKPQICLSWVLPLLDVRHCHKLSLYSVLGKKYHPNSRQWRNNSFDTDLDPLGPNLSRQFSRIWLSQSLDIMVSYHYVKYQKKLVIQYRENLVTDGRTSGRQMEEVDFKGRCSTDVERPTVSYETRKQDWHLGSILQDLINLTKTIIKSFSACKY